MAKKRNDYKIRSYFGKVDPTREMWKVMIGEDHLVTVCRSLAEAQSLVVRLNEDPYALERGNTQADRANMQATPRK